MVVLDGLVVNVLAIGLKVTSSNQFNPGSHGGEYEVKNCLLGCTAV
jgi:hypothetical protein